LATGLAVRQAESWWDIDGTEHALHDLSDEHLWGVLVWLRENGQRLWQEELDDARMLVPCPVQAYPEALGAQGWLLDTPLLRALIAEDGRRGLPAGAAEATAVDAHSTCKSTR
jgi:hypothetical protein